MKIFNENTYRSTVLILEVSWTGVKTTSSAMRY